MSTIWWQVAMSVSNICIKNKKPMEIYHMGNEDVNNSPKTNHMSPNQYHMVINVLLYVRVVVIVYCCVFPPLLFCSSSHHNLSLLFITTDEVFDFIIQCHLSSVLNITRLWKWYIVYQSSWHFPCHTMSHTQCPNKTLVRLVDDIW